MNAGPARDVRHQLDRIRAEQVRALMRNCPIGVIGAALLSVLLSITLRGSAANAIPLARYWSLLVIGGALAHLILCLVYWRVRPADAAWRRWIGWFTLIAFFEGLAWCLGALWLDLPADFLQTLVAMLAFAGMAAAGIVVFGPYMPTYLLFFVPVIAPHFYAAVRYQYPFHETLMSLVGLFLVVVPLTAWRFNIQLIEGLQLRFANLDLAEDLRQQKELAEQANLAKSSFLAAASHDLRQPIHALGLFIGALRSRKMDGEARRLVDHIDGSVSAMDDLFTSLLDISKLDAGVVEPQLEPIAVAPLIERLCADHADEAAAKGIALRRANCTATVLSDPFLLECILRNILSNAVRYTDMGAVLIGCRQRQNALSIEVWDSGCGIAASQHDLVFQEFYQVSNPERDRSKGLGLGLAIVKRMTPLINARLTFRSEPGRGSMFRLVVPRATAIPAQVVDPETLVRDARRYGLILVVDDEVAIQQAMASLLTSWGHRIIVAGSGDEMMAAMMACPDRPDLIICDYRLRGGENGIAVIARLLQYYGDTIPAMLITGDTAPDRISEAQASGYILLHKPLSNSKLRAAIGNLLRA